MQLFLFTFRLIYVEAGHFTPSVSIDQKLEAFGITDESSPIHQQTNWAVRRFYNFPQPCGKVSPSFPSRLLLKGKTERRRFHPSSLLSLNLTVVNDINNPTHLAGDFSLCRPGVTHWKCVSLLQSRLFLPRMGNIGTTSFESELRSLWSKRCAELYLCLWLMQLLTKREILMKSLEIRLQNRTGDGFQGWWSTKSFLFFLRDRLRSLTVCMLLNFRALTKHWRVFSFWKFIMHKHWIVSLWIGDLNLILLFRICNMLFSLLHELIRKTIKKVTQFRHGLTQWIQSNERIQIRWGRLGQGGKDRQVSRWTNRSSVCRRPEGLTALGFTTIWSGVGGRSVLIFQQLEIRAMMIRWSQLSSSCDRQLAGQTSKETRHLQYISHEGFARYILIYKLCFTEPVFWNNNFLQYS